MIVASVTDLEQSFYLMVFQILLALAVIVQLPNFLHGIGFHGAVSIPGKESFQIADIIIDRCCADGLREISAPCRVIGNGTVLCCIEGILSPFLQAADIVADGRIQHLTRLCDVCFFQAPAFKQAQCLLIALHRFRTQFSTSAVVHVLIDVVVEVPDKLLFLHKNALVSLRFSPNKPRAFMALRQKVYGIQRPFSARIFCVHGLFSSSAHSRKPVAPQSEICHCGRLQL